LRRSLLEFVRCPGCRGRLDFEGSGPGGGEALDAGSLRCRGCGRAFPVVAGVPRLFLGDAPPVGEFERQWRHYGGLRRLFGKDPAAMRGNLVGARMGSRIDASWYPGKAVLDAGCGHGRYLRAFASLGAVAVGLDATTAVERVAAEPGDRAVHAVRGDVLRLPFADATFDLAFCDGVLHHTTDPAAGFAELARVVRPGGAVYAWLYPKEHGLRETVFRAARAVTTRLPGGVVRALAFALAPATLFVRSYSGTRLGPATWAECAQVVHDWIAPRLQSHHTFEEAEGWARRLGLSDVERLPIPVGIVAWKPAARAS
jgi:SAM-dependent methyltransferase